MNIRAAGRFSIRVQALFKDPASRGTHRDRRREAALSSISGNPAICRDRRRNVGAPSALRILPHHQPLLCRHHRHHPAQCRFRPRSFGAVATLTVLALVTSCRTLPEQPDVNIVDWLPGEVDLAARLLVPGNEELAAMLTSLAGLSEASADKVLERTALAVFGFEAEGSAVHAAAVGLWPRGVMSGALGEKWKKSATERYRWTGPEGLELALVSREEIFVSSGRIDAMISRKDSGMRMSGVEFWDEKVRDADLAAWILKPSVFKTALPSLPLTDRNGNPLISSAALALRRTESGNYDMAMYIRAAEEKNSRSLALILRLGLSARFAMSSDQADKDLFSKMNVEEGWGEVRLFIPDLSLGFIKGFIEKSGLLPGAET